MDDSKGIAKIGGNMKDILGYEGLYRIDEQGNVERFKFNKWKPLKNWLHLIGYLAVNLFKEGKRKTLKVHRLVALAFIENPMDKPLVNHKDGIKTNPYVGNLEWSTESENSQHAVDTGLKSTKKALDAWYKPISQINSNTGEIIGTFTSIREAEKVTGVANQNISKVCKNERKLAGGFQWKYITE